MILSALRGCWRPPATGALRTVPTPTSWCSTPARFGRTPTTSSTAISATWLRVSRPIRICRSLSVVVWPRRTATPSCAGRHGWTWCSERTTSARCLPCSTGPDITARHRSRSPKRCRSSRPHCRRRASRLTRHGYRSRSDATTPVRSASSRHCAARNWTADPATSWRRSNHWSIRAFWKSPCWARTSTPTASRSPIGKPRATAALSRRCCAPVAVSRVWNACGSPRHIRLSSLTTSSRPWPRRRMCVRPCTCRCSPDPIVS